MAVTDLLAGIDMHWSEEDDELIYGIDPNLLLMQVASPETREDPRSGGYMKLDLMERAATVHRLRVRFKRNKFPLTSRTVIILAVHRCTLTIACYNASTETSNPIHRCLR